jgi:DUF4097 and DUF4098 domain-containing protein YvlB
MNCANCGAEVFAGQRFCRSCGRPTEQHPEENVPTQMMPPGGQRSPADTAPPASPYTSPVYTPPGYYQPVAPMSPVPAYVPPRTRSGWGWIVAMVGIVVLSFIVMGVVFFARIRPARTLTPPPPPNAPGEPGRQITLSRDGAVESSRETELKPITFALSANSRFSLQNVNGDISIEGWDKSEAEVTVTMHGGSVADRRALAIIPSTDGGNLSLRTGARVDGIKVDYVIKLPRRLAGISLEAVNSDINLSEVGGAVAVNNANGNVSISGAKGSVAVTTKSGSVDLSGITGDVSITVASGSIQLADVEGAVEARTISGDLSVAFNSVAPGKPIKIATTSGDVELDIKPDLDAELRAQTISGDIEIDEAFGIEVAKQLVGRRANGKIGKGGLPLTIDTVSGDIRITK